MIKTDIWLKSYSSGKHHRESLTWQFLYYKKEEDKRILWVIHFKIFYVKENRTLLSNFSSRAVIHYSTSISTSSADVSLFRMTKSDFLNSLKWSCWILEQNLIFFLFVWVFLVFIYTINWNLACKNSQVMLLAILDVCS